MVRGGNQGWYYTCYTYYTYYTCYTDYKYYTYYTLSSKLSRITAMKSDSRMYTPPTTHATK